MRAQQSAIIGLGEWSATGHVGRTRHRERRVDLIDAAPLRAAFSAPCLDYRLTHQGQVDHNWLDAWFAAQTGTQPRAR